MPTQSFAGPGSVDGGAGVDAWRGALVLAVEAIEADLRAGVERTHEYPEYLACLRTRPEADCNPLLSSAIYAGWATTETRVIHDEFGLGAILLRGGNDAVASALGELLAGAGDAIDRTAILIVVNESPNLRPRPFPESVYTSLSERTDPEVQLTLEQHRSNPFPTRAAATSAAALFHDPGTSTRVKYAALESLGHPDTPDLVDVAVRSLERSPVEDRRMDESLAAGVARCGMLCAPSIDMLAESHDEGLRRAAYLALAEMAPTDRAALGPRIALLGPPPSSMSEAETIERDRALALAADNSR